MVGPAVRPRGYVLLACCLGSACLLTCLHAAPTEYCSTNLQLITGLAETTFHVCTPAAQATINPYEGSCDTIEVAGHKLGVSKGTLAAAIVGAVFGVLILVAIIGTIVWCCCCQIRR